MGLKTAHLIGLIAWAMIIWDQSLLVETANDQEDIKASGPSRPRLPPGIAIPLPYVYPEYIDPREQTTATPSTTEDNRAEQTTSVSDIILENVRQTMLVSTPMEEFLPIGDKNNAIKSTVQGKNQHVTSTSNDNNDEPISIDKQIINSKPVEEMKRPIGKRPIRFGTRLRMPTAHSAKQNVVKTTTTPTTTTIPTCINEANSTATTSLNNNLPICHQPSATKILSTKVSTNGTRNGDNVTLRRRSTSRTRQVAIRRVRPNTENMRTARRPSRRPLRVKNTESDAVMEDEKPEKKTDSQMVLRE